MGGDNAVYSRLRSLKFAYVRWITRFSGTGLSFLVAFLFLCFSNFSLILIYLHDKEPALGLTRGGTTGAVQLKQLATDYSVSQQRVFKLALANASRHVLLR